MNLYDLSWKSDTFFGKLALFFGSMWDNLPSGDWCHIKTPEEKKQSADSCVTISSTCYSIAASAFARMKSSVKKPLLWSWLIPFDLVWCLFTWLPLGAICFVGSILFCNRALNRVQYKDLSPEQLDICQSVFRKWGCIGRARRCIWVALDKKPIKDHTAGLLWIARAEIYMGQNPRSYPYIRDCIENALLIAAKAEKDEPLQVARIFRRCAEAITVLVTSTHSQPTPEITHLLEKARELAEKAGAKDQLAKLP